MTIRTPWPRLSPRLVGAVLVAVLLLRLCFAVLLPLTEDEAYYRLWSMRLQAGYFDHPPMIAWWIAAGRRLVGDTALGVRLLPILAAAASALVLIDTLRVLRLGGRIALRAGLWINATLLIGVGGFLAVPDAPTALFWLATLWALGRAISSARPRTALVWWGLAGLAGGAAVLSKYSALFLGAGVLLWLCARAENRRHLATAGPWAAAGLAAVVVTPHLAWSAGHGWISATKQLIRVQADLFQPQFFGEFVLGQFLLLNPIIAVLAASAAFGLGKGRIGRASALLLLTSLPFILYLAGHSLHDRVQAHWTAPVYAALVGLAAIAARRRGRPDALQRWRRAAPVLGIGLSMAVLAAAAAPASDPALGKALHPLRGWPQFAATLEARAAEETARGRPVGWIGTASYGLAAQLEAQPALALPVAQLNDRARYDHLPPTDPPDFGQAGIVVDLPRRISVERLRTCFARVEPLAPLRRPGPGPAGEPGATYVAIRVSGRTSNVPGGCWRER